MVKSTGLWGRTINYEPYGHNPGACQKIAEKASMLASIPGVLRVEAILIWDSSRAVAKYKWKIQLRLLFASKEACDAYECHPLHMEWVSFVLRGWQLRRSRAADRQKEFEEYILTGTKLMLRERNPDIPNWQVVWQAEEVYSGPCVVYENI